MKILDDVEIVDNVPAIYIKSLDAIVIGDLHLGFEGIAAEQGVFIPKIQFKEEMEMMNKIIKEKKSEKIILLGDIKHEFSETTYHEFKEVRDFLNFLKINFKKVIVIKGNHDNFIFYLTKKLRVELYDDLCIGNYFFSHGHRDIDLRSISAENIVIAHEHPAIALFDEIGGKEIVKCFLIGKLKEKNIIILPAFSSLSYGTEINIVEEFLSPFLEKIKDKMYDFEAIGIDKDVGILRFGKIKNLPKR
ncbi:MAG: metallophosphoesterase [Candidatus Aenigmatarchaeota archaeon]